MKTQLFTLLLTLLLLHNLFARIVNGYEGDIAKARQSIAHLRQLLADNPQYSASHKRKLKATISQLTDVLVYHQLTDTLLHKFRLIAPDLYAQIDTLKDHRNRDVDVYVRFTPKDKAETSGSTAVTLSADGLENCTSRYGTGTVAVTIYTLNNSLAVLSHEFGHLQYMIPHFAKYCEYYHGAYRGHSRNSPGHDGHDAGGRNALKFEGRYRQRYHQYLQTITGTQVAPYQYVNDARRRVANEARYSEWQVAETPVKNPKF